MFEAAELGQKVSKSDFQVRERLLHTELLAAQRRLKDSGSQVIIIVSGVEGAGKSAVINRLNEWLDARDLQTVAFWEESDEERERPRFWRFWRVMPPRGTVGIFLGSWYTQPIVDRAFGNSTVDHLDASLRRIAVLEQMLAEDGALIVKLWFHVSQKEQQRRLKREANGKFGRRRVGPLTKKFSKRYESFAQASERAIRLTDTGNNPWTIIESNDRRFRDLTAGETLLAALNQHLDKTSQVASVEAPQEPADTRQSENSQVHSQVTVLDRVDLSPQLEADQYFLRLKGAQRRLSHLVWQAWENKINTVAVFEGWDASGKGGAIRRLTKAIDARLFRWISVAAPTEDERAQHYLWRFWKHIPRAGHVTIYDRSWYGRVLVERVEGFAKNVEWNRAYSEINEFEEQLCAHGVVLLKFWLHLSPEEQLRRFEERQSIPWKKYKITDEDWRNRDKWPQYQEAVHDMVVHTSTENAPWNLVSSEDKKWARVTVAEAFVERLELAVANAKKSPAAD